MRALGRCGSEATVHVGREPKAELVTAKCYGGDAEVETAGEAEGDKKRMRADRAF